MTSASSSAGSLEPPEELEVPNVSGLVLAGGRSRRMGRDKALLEVGGERLVDRAARTLAGFCDEVVVASGDGARIEGLAWPQIADIEAGAGPLAAIVAGLERARTALVAVVAVDMPHLSTAVLELLVREWLADGATAVAAAPVADGRVQPLHAVYATPAARRLRSLFDAGERSPAAALERLGACLVAPDVWRIADPAGAFARNLNHPADLAQLPGP